MRNASKFQNLCTADACMNSLQGHQGASGTPGSKGAAVSLGLAHHVEISLTSSLFHSLSYLQGETGRPGNPGNDGEKGTQVTLMLVR